MDHLIIKVKSVIVPELYKIRVTFSDHTEQTINLEPLLTGPMFGPLREPAIFRSVKVDQEIATVVWPNGADFDPATLHHWSAYESELLHRASQWGV